MGILERRAQGKAGEHLGGDRGARLQEEGEGADARARAVSGGAGSACGRRGDGAVRARWRAGPWRACLGRSGKRLAGPSTVWERAARGGGTWAGLFHWVGLDLG